MNEFEPLDPELANLLSAERGREVVVGPAKARSAKKLSALLAGTSVLTASATAKAGGWLAFGLGGTKVGVALFFLGGALGGVAVALVAIHERPAATAGAVQRIMPPIGAPASQPQVITTPSPHVATAAPIETKPATEPPVQEPSTGARVEALNRAEARSSVAPRRVDRAPSMPIASVAASDSPAQTVVESPTEGQPDALARERALLDDARTALAAHADARTLNICSTHAQLFPNGQLVAEREILAIRALSNLGHADEAKARADRFRRTHPTSILLPALPSALDPQK